jgi:SAM-dependent methyltransferase
MKKSLLIVFILIISFSSCTMMNRVFLRNKISSYKGHSQHCRLYTEKDSTDIKYFDGFTEIAGIKDFDTILSIGAGSGGREFLISLYSDNVLFYLQDIDTSCISQQRIFQIYYPHYSKLRGKPITNRFITVQGNDTSTCMLNMLVDKVLIYNVYHHFTDDIAMVNECSRVLRKNGKLIICEHVMNRNKKSYKFCDYGGYYKTEENFINDIENAGFKCEVVIPNGKYWRLFIFKKN